MPIFSSAQVEALPLVFGGSYLSIALIACTSEAPPPGIMPSCTAARVADQRILDAMLFLLELRFGGRADLDDGDAAGELCEALLELLAIEVRVGLFDLLLESSRCGP